jgi:hypothetical protein
VCVCVCVCVFFISTYMVFWPETVSSTLSFLVLPFVLIRHALTSVWSISIGRENLAKLHISLNVHAVQSQNKQNSPPPAASRAFIHRGAYQEDPTKPSARTAQRLLLWSPTKHVREVVSIRTCPDTDSISSHSNTMAQPHWFQHCFILQ